MKQDLSNITTVLLDIEGTICPISFVKETLFPYALAALPKVLNEQWSDPSFTPYRDAFPAETRSSPATLEAYVRDLTERDVKVACLKGLQGYLWRSGYESNVYATPLFPDVLPSLTSWSTSNIKVSIYSSGSIPAQHLLMSHIRPSSSQPSNTFPSPSPSQTGPSISATHLINTWHDTTNGGPKLSPSSYVRIAGDIGVSVDRVVFFSDSVGEVEAAITAGMRGIVVVRPGNARLSEEERERHDVVEGFEGVRIG